MFFGGGGGVLDGDGVEWGMIKNFIYEMNIFTKVFQAKNKCFLRYNFIKVVLRINNLFPICHCCLILLNVTVNGFWKVSFSYLLFIFIVIVISEPTFILPDP